MINSFKQFNQPHLKLSKHKWKGGKHTPRENFIDTPVFSFFFKDALTLLKISKLPS